MSRLTDEQELGKRTDQDRADTPEAREARIRFHEQRIAGLGLAGRGRGVAGQSKATTIPPTPKPPRERMTWEQERERRKQRRQSLTLAKLAAAPKPNPAVIVAECCAEVGVDPAVVLADVRTPWMCLARWRVWRAMRNRGMRVTAIGAAVGRDHSTISEGLQRLQRKSTLSGDLLSVGDATA